MFDDTKKMRADDQQRIGLENIASDIGSGGGTLVEIGSYIGESTIEFARHFDEVYAVDAWQWGGESTAMSEPYHADQDGVRKFVDIPLCHMVEKEFDENIKSIPNIKKIKAFDYDVVDDFKDASLDAVYIDSEHSYRCVMDTYRRWMPKLKSGGYLSGHDYMRVWPGVVRAVDEISVELGMPPKTYVDGSWHFRMIL